VFRREIEGVGYYFEVAGLWGSGNTVTERDLRATDENTVYTMWTGEGLIGPRTGEFIDKYPALWGTTTLERFVDRYGWLGEECKVFLGEQEVSPECESACAHVSEICSEETGATCLERCGQMSDETVDCLAAASACSDAKECL
jgi:hypothetical protein